MSKEVHPNKNISLEELGDALEVGVGSDKMYSLDEESLFNQYPKAVAMLATGYVDYCAEVIRARAICGIDGLKPVQRRVLYTAKKGKYYNLTKCKKISGATLQYHPHSDQPVYETLVRMTDKKNIMTVPLFEGKGTFGKVYSDRKPSDARYTEAKLHSNAEEYFGEMQGIDYVSTYDDTDVEPMLLPVSYPSILMNPTQGIAVGLASIIPSFNPVEVIDLALEYLETGDIQTLIRPDQTSGAIYVENTEELYKVMKTGKGRLKFRGRVEISGKEIIIRELPHGISAERLKKQILSLDYQGISDVGDHSDRGGLGLTVYCSNAKIVNNILMALYKNTDLQTTLTTNMTVIIDNEPKLLGAWGIIKEWCRFREGVFRKQFLHNNAVLMKKANSARAKVLFLENTDICDKYIELVRTRGKKVAKEYIKGCFADASEDDISSMLSIGLSQLGDIEEFRSELNSILREVDEINKILEDLKPTMIADLRRVRSKLSYIKRRTEITEQDFVFVEDNKVVVDDTPCTILYKDGFLKKVAYTGYINEADYQLVMSAKANDTLIGIDTDGRILRVYLSQLDYCSSTEIGEYLPKYWDIEGNELVSLELLDGKKKMLIYSDGKFGFLDTSDWLNNSRQVRVIEVGVSSEANKLVDVIDIPESIAIVTKKGLFGLAYTENMNTDVSRKARTLVFKIDNDDCIKYFVPLKMTEVPRYIKNQERYICNKSKPRKLVQREDLDYTALSSLKGFTNTYL